MIDIQNQFGLTCKYIPVMSCCCVCVCGVRSNLYLWFKDDCRVYKSNWKDRNITTDIPIGKSATRIKELKCKHAKGLFGHKHIAQSTRTIATMEYQIQCESVAYSAS